MLVRPRVARWLGKTLARQFHLTSHRVRRLDRSSSVSTMEWALGSVGSTRSFSLSNDRRQSEDGGSKAQAVPLPRIWYVHKPFDWLRYKMDFRHLRTRWDPDFSETDFTAGARQAISTLSQLISKNMYDAMRPLLTRSALVNLRRDVEILWTDEVRRNIALYPVDIQLVIPIKVYLRRIEDVNQLGTDKRLCDVDLVFIGMKHIQTHRAINPVIAFIDIIARFHRNYTEGVPPDWTVASFRLRKFNLLRTRGDS